MVDMEAKRLENIMAQCYGTEQYWKHPVFDRYKYTDGVRTFAIEGKCWWFVEDSLMYLSELPYDFYCVKLKVKNRKGDLIIDDGNGKVIKKHHYGLADCPDGEWVFFAEGDVFLWCGEH